MHRGARYVDDGDVAVAKGVAGQTLGASIDRIFPTAISKQSSSATPNQRDNHSSSPHTVLLEHSTAHTLKHLGHEALCDVTHLPAVSPFLNLTLTGEHHEPMFKEAAYHQFLCTGHHFIARSPEDNTSLLMLKALTSI